MVYATDDPGDHVDPGAVDAARRKVGTLCVESIVDDSPYQPLSAYLVELASTDDAALVAAASDRRARPEGEYPACPPTWTDGTRSSGYSEPDRGETIHRVRRPVATLAMSSKSRS